MVTESERTTTAPRRWELDALRALVVLGLVFFHSGLVFSPDVDFYIKNDETSEAVNTLAGLGVVWAMPMLFLVAGLGARHSIRRRGPRGFARERLLRLGVPLVFATFALLPLPQWLRERAADPGYHESYWRFWPRFLTVHLDLTDFPFILDGEHFETGHLWFVVLLLAFCLLLAPVATPLAAIPERTFTAVTRHPTLLLLPAIPLACVNTFLGMEEGFAVWNRWAYLLFFLYGYALADDDRIRAATRRLAVPVGVAGLALFAATAPGFAAEGDPFTDWNALALVTRTVFSVAGWCWVTAILGLLDRRRERSRPQRPDPPDKEDPGKAERRGRVWAYAAPAVMPMYVLHQPVVVAIAYAVVGWSAPMLVKYAVIVAGSLAAILVLYEFLVRRTRVTRFLFGMRPHPAVPPTA